MYKLDMLWRRTAAFVIDYNIYLPVAMLLMGLSAFLALAGQDSVGGVYFGLAIVFSAPLLALLYFPIFYCSRHQATIGMQAVKIHIADMNEMHIGFFHALWRGFIDLVIVIAEGYFVLFPLTKTLFAKSIAEFMMLSRLSQLSPQYKVLHDALVHSPHYILGVFIFVPIVLSVQLVTVLITREAQSLSDILGRTLVFSIGEELWTKSQLPPAMKKLVVATPKLDRSLQYHSPSGSDDETRDQQDNQF